MRHMNAVVATARTQVPRLLGMTREYRDDTEKRNLVNYSDLGRQTSAVRPRTLDPRHPTSELKPRLKRDHSWTAIAT